MSVHCFQNSVLSGAQWDRNHSAEGVSGLPVAWTLLQSHQVGPHNYPLQPSPPLLSALSGVCGADTVLMLRIRREYRGPHDLCCVLFVPFLCLQILTVVIEGLLQEYNYVQLCRNVLLKILHSCFYSSDRGFINTTSF